MKKILYSLLISLRFISAFAQSTTLLPGSGDFKSDKVIIGVSPVNVGKLQVNETVSNVGVNIHTGSTVSSSNITGLLINANNSTSSVKAASLNFGGGVQNTGIELNGNDLGITSVGYLTNLNRTLNNGNVYGFLTNLIHNGSGSGVATGALYQISGTGDIEKKGIDINLSGTSGTKTGLNLLLHGNDPSSSSSNMGGFFTNTVTNSAVNYGIRSVVNGGNTNFGIHVTATGANAVAGLFNGLVVNNDYTKLGAGAPKIQQKEILGTSPATNLSNTYPHGLIDSKILSVSILVDVSNQFIPPNYTGNPTLEYNYYVFDGNLYILNKNGNSSSLSEKPFKALITYKE